MDVRTGRHVCAQMWGQPCIMDNPHFHTDIVNCHFYPYTEELLNYPLDCSTQAIIIMPILTALYTMLSDSVQVCILHSMLLHNARIACVLLSIVVISGANPQRQHNML